MNKLWMNENYSNFFQTFLEMRFCLFEMWFRFPLMVRLYQTLLLANETVQYEIYLSFLLFFFCPTSLTCSSESRRYFYLEELKFFEVWILMTFASPLDNLKGKVHLSLNYNSNDNVSQTLNSVFLKLPKIVNILR